MGKPRDVMISAFGLLISGFGSIKEDLFFIGIGMLVLMLEIYLVTTELKEEIESLKRQFNLHLEIKKSGMNSGG